MEQKIKKALTTHQMRNLTWYGKAIIINSLAASKVVHNARIIKVPKETANLIERLLFNFIWAPEKIEPIKRSHMKSTEIMGDLKITCIKSKIEACKLEKYKILTSIEEPTEFWHHEAVYILGSKLKKINEKLYTNSAPHSIIVSDEWKNIIKRAEEMKWENENWAEAAHRDLCIGIKKLNAKHIPRITKSSGQDIKWRKITTTNGDSNPITNAERVVNIRTAAKGFFLGEDRKRLNIFNINSMNKTITECKFCGQDEDNIEHIMVKCKLAKNVFSAFKRLIKQKEIDSENILYNEKLKNKTDWTIMSIIKKEIIKRKFGLDKVNQKVKNFDMTVKDVVNKIIKKLFKRILIFDNTTEEQLFKNELVFLVEEYG